MFDRSSPEWCRLQRDLPPDTLTAVEHLAAHMERGGRGQSQPVREIFGLLGDRWSTLIILLLRNGWIRFAILQRTINCLSAEAAISHRMLSLKLRALERNGIIIREETADVPPRVSYMLADFGEELTERVWSLVDFIATRRPVIDHSRNKFDRRTRDAP